jgi:hypothetical protein
MKVDWNSFSSDDRSECLREYYSIEEVPVILIWVVRPVSVKIPENEGCRFL